MEEMRIAKGNSKSPAESRLALEKTPPEGGAFNCTNNELLTLARNALRYAGAQVRVRLRLDGSVAFAEERYSAEPTFEVTFLYAEVLSDLEIRECIQVGRARAVLFGEPDRLAT